MSRDSKTNGTERLRTMDAAATGREDLEVIELFRVAKTKLEHTMPPKAAIAEQTAEIPEGLKTGAPSRMQMLETADAAMRRPGVMLPEQAEWMRMEAALRDQFRARQKRALRRRLLHPYVVAALVATILAAVAYALVIGWQGGAGFVDYLRGLFSPTPALGAMGAAGDPAALAQALADMLHLG